MGCYDKESNFQRAIFRGDKWWMADGSSPSWEGPIDELAKKFPEFHEPNFIRGNVAYSVDRLENDAALVKPLGRITVDNLEGLYLL